MSELSFDTAGGQRMTRLRRTLARRLRRAADHLDPPGVLTVRLAADTTAIREAMERAARLHRLGGGIR